MKKVSAHLASALLCAFVLSIDLAQAQTQITNTDHTVGTQTTGAELRFATLLAQTRPKKRTGFSLMPESRYADAGGPAFAISPMATGGSLPVVGSGSLGRLTKWAGFTSSNSVIGNSTIFEDKFGMVGIGTDSPTSRLTVGGMIETLSGGLKFPDGTIQTTSATGALFSVAHDATLQATGLPARRLGLRFHSC